MRILQSDLPIVKGTTGATGTFFSQSESSPVQNAQNGHTSDKHNHSHVTPEKPIDIMLAAFPNAYEKGNGYWTHDNNPRFDLREEEDGHVSIHSWTGRSAEQILAMGSPALKLSDLYPKGQAGNYKPAYREKQFDLVTLSQYMKLPWQYLDRLGYRDGYTYKNKMGRKTVCVK